MFACSVATPVVAPGPPPAAVCPAEGCDVARIRAIEASATPDACAAGRDAPCGGATPSECTARALGAWSEARDDRAVACVARSLSAACELGDGRGCGFAGRLALDGRGTPRDVHRGITLLDRACSDGFVLSCRVAVHWLADADHARDVPDAAQVHGRLDLQLDCLSGVGEACRELGLRYSQGREGFPRDLSRACAGYERGCALGDRVACNNLGDAYEYGDGVPRDLARSAALYDRACGAGEPLGCANLGHLIENGEGAVRDGPRARALYRDACAGGSDYGCLHEEMAAAFSLARPDSIPRALSRWQKACDARSARACAFVGILYEDGPDGQARDAQKSLQAMTRACELGEARACVWVRSRGP